MSSELSPYAVYRILGLVQNNDGRRRTKRAALVKRHPRNVNKKWRYVNDAYFTRKRTPGMDHLRSLELTLVLGNVVDLTAMLAVSQKPLVFGRDRPGPFVRKIVEAFQRLKEDPPFLDITLVEPLKGWPSTVLATVWPRVYIDYLPCRACTKFEQEYLLVETFHVPSKHSVKQLTVELHFTLEDPEQFAEDGVCPLTDPWLKKELREVTIHFGNLPCSSTPSGPARRSKSLLMLPEFASEVYGFLERAFVGTSLLASRALNELISKLSSRLPVHRLSVRFEKRFEGRSCMRYFRGNYSMSLRHFRRDISYSDVRRFKVPSKAGPAADCALILRYLSNSHLADFKTPDSDSRFAFRMLAALADRNFSVDTLRMVAEGGGLSDYRSMDTVFAGGLRLNTLEMSLFDHELATLVKTTDFFRAPTVQKLKALKLELVCAS